MVILHPLTSFVFPICLLLQLFRSFDENRDGTLNFKELKQGLKRYNFNLTDLDIQRLASLLDADQGDSVSYDEFMKVLNDYRPLGEMTQGKTEQALQVAAPWEPLEVPNKNLKVWDKNVHPTAPYLQKGTKEGTVAMKHADARTVRLVSSRFYQAASRIRHVFRKLDMDKNGVVDRKEFLYGVKQLGLGIPEDQVARFFDLIDTDAGGHGHIDYVEFLKRFDGEAPDPKLPAPDRAGPALVTKLDLSPEEVEDFSSGSKCRELRERFYSQCYPAHTVFRRFDTDSDGHMSLEEFGEACRKLLPGVTDREAACFMASIDPATDGYMSLPQFTACLGSARPPHPREAHKSAALDGDTTYKSMQGGTKTMLGDSCLPHGPGEPPLNYPTVASIYARVNATRTEARAPALEQLWRSLSAAADSETGGFAPNKPGARTLRRQAEQRMAVATAAGARQAAAAASRPCTAPEGSVRSSGSGHASPLVSGERSLGSTRTSSARDMKSTTGGSKRETWNSRTLFGFGPSPGAPGGKATGLSLDPKWERAGTEFRRNFTKIDPYSHSPSTKHTIVPVPDCPSAWDPATHYNARPGVGGMQKSTIVNERRQQAVARSRAQARCQISSTFLSARKAEDAAAVERRDAGRLQARADGKRRMAERLYLYDKCGVSETDRISNTYFMRKY